MKRKKILFLNLPNYCPDRKFYCLPLGLAYLAAFLDAEEHILKGLDLAATRAKNRDCYLHSPRKYLDRIVRFQPDYVLISCLVHNRFNVFYWARVIKQAVPGVKIIIGNQFASAKPVEILQNVPEIDYAVLGEGEKTIAGLIRGLGKKDMRGVSNVCYRNAAGGAVVRKKREILSLSALPFPQRGIFNADEYVARFGDKTFPRVAPILGSRGCPMRCTFCSCRVFEGNVYRVRDADDILGEIKVLSKQGYERFMFIDDTFTINEKHAAGFCKKVIENKIKIQWLCWSCLNISLDLLGLMKEAGCVFIAFGLESADAGILGRFKKNIRIGHCARVLRRCAELGIDIRLTLLLDSGYETNASLRETFRFLKRSRISRDMVDYSNNVWVFPGTDLEKSFLGDKHKTFDWFRPRVYDFEVEKDAAGNQIVPVFKRRGGGKNARTIEERLSKL